MASCENRSGGRFGASSFTMTVSWSKTFSKRRYGYLPMPASTSERPKLQMSDQTPYLSSAFWIRSGWRARRAAATKLSARCQHWLGTRADRPAAFLRTAM